MKNILIVTFSNNADHQDIAFGIFESLYRAKSNDYKICIMGTKSPKVPVIETPCTHLVDCPERPGIEKDTFNLRILTNIIKWINKKEFDVIFFESLHTWNIPIMLLCHKKTKIYQMIHDVIPHKGDKQEKKVHLMNKTVCKLADYIVLCNRKYIESASNIYGIDHNKLRWVDMWRRFPQYTQPRYTKRILFFGRLNLYKGIDNLVEIVKKCANIQFDIVGKVDSQVENDVLELRAMSNVNMKTGYVSDREMEDAFINADWVILPYKSATQSGVIIDGYRYGRPCIAFNVGAVSEQIEDGVSGYLIKAGDVDAFSQKIMQVVNMGKDDYDNISQNAYRYGIKKYSSISAKDRFLKLLDG